MRELKSAGAVYKIEKMQGCGQSATVFRAIRMDSRGLSSQTVALKIFNSGTAVTWMRREFETLAQVNSPHCVRVLGWENLAQGGCALVLEWIDGLTLLEVGQKMRLSDELIVEVVAQIQAGLAALTESGYCHGDLSPANLIIDRFGCVKIVDFASPPADESTVTGTPAYLAPETWSGQKPDGQSDLFSLGLIEMDLKTAFHFVPASQDECRKRARASAQETPGLLALSPNQRRLKEVVSTVESKQALARQVNQLMMDLQNTKLQTVVIEPHDLWRGRRMRAALVIVILFITTAAPVQAGAPIEPKFVATSATLSVRTQNWLLLTLNGAALGYSPKEIHGLQPGSYHLTWQSRTGAGETQFSLRPGETLHLGDADLNRVAKR